MPSTEDYWSFLSCTTLVPIRSIHHHLKPRIHRPLLILHDVYREPFSFRARSWRRSNSIQHRRHNGTRSATDNSSANWHLERRGLLHAHFDVLPGHGDKLSSIVNVQGFSFGVVYLWDRKRNISGERDMAKSTRTNHDSASCASDEYCCHKWRTKRTYHVYIPLTKLEDKFENEVGLIVWVPIPARWRKESQQISDYIPTHLMCFVPRYGDVRPLLNSIPVMTKARVLDWACFNQCFGTQVVQTLAQLRVIAKLIWGSTRCQKGDT